MSDKYFKAWIVVDDNDDPDVENKIKVGIIDGLQRYGVPFTVINTDECEQEPQHLESFTEAPTLEVDAK